MATLLEGLRRAKRWELFLLLLSCSILGVFALRFGVATANNDAFWQLLAVEPLLQGAGYGFMEGEEFQPYRRHPPALTVIGAVLHSVGLDPLLVLSFLQIPLLLASLLLTAVALSRALGLGAAVLVSMAAHATLGVLQTHLRLHTEPIAHLLSIVLFLLILAPRETPATRLPGRVSALIGISWALSLLRYSSCFLVAAALGLATRSWHASWGKRASFLCLAGALAALPVGLFFLRNAGLDAAERIFPEGSPMSPSLVAAEMNQSLRSLQEIFFPRLMRMRPHFTWLVVLLVHTPLVLFYLWRRRSMDDSVRRLCTAAFTFGAVPFVSLWALSLMTGYSFAAHYRFWSYNVFWLSLAALSLVFWAGRAWGAKRLAIAVLIAIASLKLGYAVYYEVRYAPTRSHWADYTEVRRAIAEELTDTYSGTKHVSVDTSVGPNSRNVFLLLAYSSHRVEAPWKVSARPGAVDSVMTAPIGADEVILISSREYSQEAIERLCRLDRLQCSARYGILLVGARPG